MKKYIIPCFLFFAITACNNNKEEEKVTVVDSIEVAGEISNADSLLVFENNGAEWITGKFKLPGISWQNVELENFWNSETLEEEPFEPGKNFYNDYAPVLRWSPDSTYLLDFGSYGLIAIKDALGKTTLEGGDPDTEVSVIFPKEGKKARLLFAGPSSHIMDAKWMGKTQAMIIGTFNLEDNLSKDTLIWLVDVKDHFFRLYNYKQQR